MGAKTWQDTVIKDNPYYRDGAHKAYEEGKLAQAELSFNLRTEDILKQLKGFNQRGLTITEAIDLLQ